MVARPLQVIVLVAASGIATLFFLEASLPISPLAPATLGTGCVLVTTLALLRELRFRERSAIAFGASFLGLLAAAAAESLAHPWPAGFGAAFLPAVLLFIGGVGRERLTFELARLEDDLDVPERRPEVIARATIIRDAARKGARRLDPKASSPPIHAGDARGIYAYAAQVVALAHALDGRSAEAAASLGEVPAAWMPAPMRVLMLCNLAQWQLCAGDIDGAQRTLTAAHDKVAPPSVRPFLRGARAALLVRSGSADAALDLIGHEDGQHGEPPSVRQRYRITRAHALAAKGDVDGARAELQRVLDDDGAEELRRWLPAGGPAQAAMQDILAAT